VVQSSEKFVLGTRSIINPVFIQSTILIKHVHATQIVLKLRILQVQIVYLDSSNSLIHVFNWTIARVNKFSLLIEPHFGFIQTLRGFLEVSV
jgi:hypothetical protein